jgi:hypothetical protein
MSGILDVSEPYPPMYDQCELCEEVHSLSIRQGRYLCFNCLSLIEGIERWENDYLDSSED